MVKEYKELFSSNIYKFKVSNYKNLNKKLISEIYELYNENTRGIHRSNYGGWHSDILYPYKLSDIRFGELSKIISNFYSKEILKIEKNVMVSTMWANINKKNDYNSTHEHSSSHYSGCYYVKVPKNSGNFYFINRDTAFTSPNNLFKGCYEEIKYEPEEGDLYIFSSTLLHRVGKSFSDDERISIAFNFDVPDLKEQL